MRSIRTLFAALAFLSLAACHNGASDAEKADGMKLRRIFRSYSNEIADVNSTEYEYAVNGRDFLTRITDGTPQSPTWPQPEQIDKFLDRLAKIMRRRKAVQDALSTIDLLGPLPVAVREDVREVLGERLAVNRDWRIGLDSLRQAFVDKQEREIRNTAARLTELFQAYGPLQNTLELAANDLEEQLRLPWNEENDSSMGKQPVPAPSQISR